MSRILGRGIDFLREQLTGGDEFVPPSLPPLPSDATRDPRKPVAAPSGASGAPPSPAPASTAPSARTPASVSAAGSTPGVAGGVVPALRRAVSTPDSLASSSTSAATSTPAEKPPTATPATPASAARGGDGVAAGSEAPTPGGKRRVDVRTLSREELVDVVVRQQAKVQRLDEKYQTLRASAGRLQATHKGLADAIFAVLGVRLEDILRPDGALDSLRLERLVSRKKQERDAEKLAMRASYEAQLTRLTSEVARLRTAANHAAAAAASAAATAAATASVHAAPAPAPPSPPSVPAPGPAPAADVSFPHEDTRSRGDSEFEVRESVGAGSAGDAHSEAGSVGGSGGGGDGAGGLLGADDSDGLSDASDDLILETGRGSPASLGAGHAIERSVSMVTRRPRSSLAATSVTSTASSASSSSAVSSASASSSSLPAASASDASSIPPPSPAHLAAVRAPLEARIGELAARVSALEAEVRTAQAAAQAATQSSEAAAAQAARSREDATRWKSMFEASESLADSRQKQLEALQRRIAGIEASASASASVSASAGEEDAAGGPPRGPLSASDAELLWRERELAESTVRELQARARRARQVVAEKDVRIGELEQRVAQLEEAVARGDPQDRMLLEFATSHGLHEEELRRTKAQVGVLRGAVEELQLELQLEREQAAVLKTEIRRLERVSERSGVSLEYLKNVVVQYMAFPADAAERQPLVNVIGTLLLFDADDWALATHKTQNVRALPRGGGVAGANARYLDIEERRASAVAAAAAAAVAAAGGTEGSGGGSGGGGGAAMATAAAAAAAAAAATAAAAAASREGGVDSGTAGASVGVGARRMLPATSAVATATAAAAVASTRGGALGSAGVGAGHPISASTPTEEAEGGLFSRMWGFLSSPPPIAMAVPTPLPSPSPPLLPSTPEPHGLPPSSPTRASEGQFLA